MRIISILLLTLAFSSCQKAKNKEPELITCPNPLTLSWFTAIKAENQSCICLVGARQGIYQNQPVIEVYLYDPLCDGINLVYKADGSVWFNSSEAIYADYKAKVTDQKIIWTCSGGDQ